MGASKEEFTNLRHYLEQHYNWCEEMFYETLYDNSPKDNFNNG
jgi:hypothetical protein|tara:strand:- start:654 stop:782 length:129 start_codon:yes stop_codon:yes gene_type:complete